MNGNGWDLNPTGKEEYLEIETAGTHFVKLINVRKWVSHYGVVLWLCFLGEDGRVFNHRQNLYHPKTNFILHRILSFSAVHKEECDKMGINWAIPEQFSEGILYFLQERCVGNHFHIVLRESEWHKREKNTFVLQLYTVEAYIGNRRITCCPKPKYSAEYDQITKTEEILREYVSQMADDETPPF